MDNPIQAIGLFSGGLDSILAVRLLLEQGLRVEALHVVLPVHKPKLRAWVEEAAAQLGVPLYVVTLEQEFFDLLRHPRHGYGSGMNPCLDCHILLLRQAAERMKQVGASFVFTGEVLGERPFSQHRAALELVERKAGLEGRLLRPLSAQLLPPTIPEQEGLVNRSQLLGFQGRRRQPQESLARHYGIEKYPRPAGGCFLTNREMARRVRDLLDHSPEFTRNDFDLVRLGRHFRLSPAVKAIAGRDQGENERLLSLAERGDVLLEVKGAGSPVTLLRGIADPTMDARQREEALRLAAAITARYSDAPTRRVLVHYGPVSSDRPLAVEVERADPELLDRLRI